MNRSSLFRWSTRWAIGSVVCLLLIALSMMVVNAFDYAPYGLALRRANKLNPEDLERLAATCSRYEKVGHQHFIDDSIPSEFRALKPARVSISPGGSDISLLEHGDDRYVFLRVSTSPANQDIKLVSYCGQHQRSKTLWERNPDLARQYLPTGRIVTFSQWAMNSGREWIVMPTRLLVIDRITTVGGSDRIAADVPLNAEQRRSIENAIRDLSPEVRGHAFDAGASDGISLSISFSSDGIQNLTTDIVLANAWRSEVEELVQSISKLAGKDFEIAFPKIVKSIDILQGRPPIVLTLAEWDRTRNGIRLPWWCWWPRLIDDRD